MKRFLFAGMLCSLHFFIGVDTIAEILYVRPNAQSTAWSNKSNVFNDLQSALGAAQNEDEIWIAAGTYKPTTTLDRNISFVISSEVNLYGGFEGSENSREDRNWINNKTILSGNIGNNNVDTDNSYRVIRFIDTQREDYFILDGLIISDGRADGEGIETGAGIYCSSNGTLRIVNCVFENNYASARGGAIASENTTLRVANTIFKNNYAESEGAAYYGINLRPAFDNCIFYANTVSTEGFSPVVSSNADIRNSILWANSHNRGWLGSSYYAGSRYYNCIIEDGPSNNNCISSNPLFEDAENGDFRLRMNSPGINAGNMNELPDWLLFDFEGKLRVANYQVDIGVFENIREISPKAQSPLKNQVFNAETTQIQLTWIYDNFLQAIGHYEIEVIDHNSTRSFQVEATTSLLIEVTSGYEYKWRVKGTYESKETGWSEFSNFYIKRENPIYVKEGALGSGNNWGDALGDLNKAISIANPGDQIWVAAGTYMPVDEVRGHSFWLKNGVEVYGGFSGNESKLEQRSWVGNKTNLVGNKADTQTSFSTLSGIGGINDNLPIAVMDGFIIKDGYCAFLNNRQGGGIELQDFKITIKNCIISDNSAYMVGGGIYSQGSDLSIYNCIISNNSSASSGAGVYVSGGNTNIYNSLITRNRSSASYPAGLSNDGFCNVYNTIITDNDAYSDFSPDVTSRRFLFNCIVGDEDVKIIDEGLNIDPTSVCVNAGNNQYVNLSEMPTDFYGRARIKGENVDIGPFELGNPSPTPVQPLHGAIISNVDNAQIKLLWERHNETKDCDIEYWTENGDSILLTQLSENSILQDWPKGQTNWRLRYSNEQDNWSTVFSFVNQTKGKIIYVDSRQDGDGTSWGQAYKHLQDALAEASYSDEIWVAKGTYHPTQINNRDASFELKNGVQLYGGFTGNEQAREERNPAMNQTILSGEIGELGVETDNTKNIVSIRGTERRLISNTTTISGFVIEDGYGVSGVAIFLSNASANINSCIIQNNYSISNGAGIYCFNASVNISEVIFSNNSSQNSGTAIFANNPNNSNVLVTNCTFYGNRNNDGRSNSISTVYNWAQSSSNFRLINCIFWQNTKYYDLEITGCEDFNCSFELKTTKNSPIFGDPLFEDAENGDFRLKPNSPCINQGNAKYISSTFDYLKQDRIIGNTIDIGAIESPNIPIVLLEPLNNHSLNYSPPILPHLKWKDYSYSIEKQYLSQYWIKGSNDTIHIEMNENQRTPLFDIQPNKIYQWRVGQYIEDVEEYYWSEINTFYTGRNYPIYVKEGGAGDGSSWESPLGDLNEALILANDGDQIWMAQGTYYPTDDGDRNKSFLVSSNINLLGGFNGTELSADIRDASANITTLSGNIGAENRDDDNSHRIMVVEGNSDSREILIDGVVFQEGFSSDTRGALLVKSGNAVFRNCIVRNNFSEEGSAIIVQNSAPVFINSLFYGNVSNSIRGTIDCASNSNTEIINSTITRNFTKGISAVYGPAQVVNSIVYGNTSATGGLTFNEAKVSYSCIDHWNGGLSNIYSNPKFVSENDFSLDEKSPCINNGNNNALTNLEGVDMVKRPRVFNDYVDIGAFEYQEIGSANVVTVNSLSSIPNDINPIYEIVFDRDIRIIDENGISVDNYYGPIEILSLKDNKLVVKVSNLDFDSSYRMSIEEGTYVSDGNINIQGNEYSYSFETRSCINGQLSFMADEFYSCPRESLIINVITKGDVKRDYIWSKNGDTLTPYSGKDSMHIESFTNETAGLYICNLTDMCGNRLASEFQAEMKQHVVDFDIETQWDDILVVDNSSNRFSEYVWFNENDTVNIGSQFITSPPGVSASYMVKVRDALSNCYLYSDTLKVGMFKSSQHTLSVYPNPLKKSRMLTVDMGGRQLSGTITLFNLNGISIYSDRFVNAGQYSLNGASIPEGVYVLEVETGESVKSTKLIITK